MLRDLFARLDAQLKIIPSERLEHSQIDMLTLHPHGRRRKAASCSINNARFDITRKEVQGFGEIKQSIVLHRQLEDS